MKITSPAFEHNSRIPSKYTCDSDNVIPPLAISDIPPDTKSLVLIMDDPDAPSGTWDHWILWNLAPGTTEIKEGRAPTAVYGRNSWGKTIYGGPCPPDREHRYFFKLYALDTELDLPEGSTKQQLLQAMESHIIGKSELIGLYERS